MTVDIETVLLGFVTIVLLPMTAWLGKRQIDRAEAATEELNLVVRGPEGLESRFSKFREEVIGGYVKESRHTTALSEMEDRIFRKLEDIERAQARLFDKLDGKADKGFRHPEAGPFGKGG